jgi:multicomponent K+:H+ antiporter subunit A
VLIVSLVLLPLVGSVLPLIAPGRGGRRLALLSAIPTAVALVILAMLGPRIFAGEVLRSSWEWVPRLGLEATFRLDGLAWLFGVLVLGIGLLILLYSSYYMSEREAQPRFYAALMLFGAAMMGVVVSGNLIQLVIFWELTSLSSFLLIGYRTGEAGARVGAMRALVVTGAGGLALLGGALLLGRMAGSHDLDVVFAAADTIRAHELYTPALILVALGAFTKSAQFPFHFWLPGAMAAPTPVSAYLHSATMVKAGVFLLARLYPVLSGTDLWLVLVGAIGLVTLLAGAYAAMWQHDLKGLLAYSTISHLGLITLLLGFGTEMAAVAAVFHIVNHATFKASLFMAAGIIDHEAGTRDMRALHGLWKYMPWTGALALISAAAMAGVPLLNGFLSKEMFFTEALHAHRAGGYGWLVPVAATLAGALSVGYSLRFMMEVFFSRAEAPPAKVPHDPPMFMLLPVGALSLLCVLVGVLPSIVVAPALSAAVSSVIAAPTPEYSLALWHGLNVPLLMTIAALGGGVALFRLRQRLYELHDRHLPRIPAAVLFDRGMNRAIRLAASITAASENGSLQRYQRLLIGAALVVATAPFVEFGWSTGSATMSLPDPATTIVWGMLVAAVFATVSWRDDRLTAVISISVVGLLVSLGFSRLSAPDLVITQLLVELVTIVLLLLALHFLPAAPPEEHSRSERLRKVRDVGLSAAAGLGAGALAWMVMTREASTISRYFIEQSLPKGGGTNIVNVILVDFRGFDTFGEIVVVAAAGLGVLAMISRMRITRSAADVPLVPFDRRHPVILTMISRPILPMAVLLSIFILLRGHDLPGGGFAAGLLTSVALILQYMASGVEWTAQRLKVDFQRVVAAGVVLAAMTGLWSVVEGRPFLTSSYEYASVPGIGKVPLSSALVFDVGVYLTVVGAVMLILGRLGKLKADDPMEELAAETAAREEEATWNR